MKKRKLPKEKCFGKLESVFSFYGAMPTGVTISEKGRVYFILNLWFFPMLVESLQYLYNY